MPRGTYAPVCVVAFGPERFVGVSGQTCRVAGVPIAGACGLDATMDTARHAARVAMLNALAALATAAPGGLASVRQVVRLRGFVRSTPTFTDHPAVLDAASEVLGIAFPRQPLPARSAVGVASLPGGSLIEIELDAIVAP